MSDKKKSTRERDEQRLIDALIHAMKSCHEDKIHECGDRLVCHWASAQGSDDEGLLLRYSDLTDGGEDLEEDATESEIEEWIEQRAIDAFEDPEGQGWQVVKITSSAGKRAFVAQLLQGCSFEGIESDFLGVFTSVAAAKKAIKAVGYLDIDDFHARHPVNQLPPLPRALRIRREQDQANSGSPQRYVTEVERLRVCGTCCRLYETGRPDGLNQQCACNPRDVETWPHFDFNERALLCLCCGLRPLRSGSKFSPFFCEDCVTPVMNVSRLCARLVFPIGRHSFMHTWVPGTRTPTLAAHGGDMNALADSVLASLEAIESGSQFVFQWSRLIVSRNLARVGLAGGASLSEYLEAVEQHETELTPSIAFAEMFQFFTNLGTAGES